MTNEKLLTFNSTISEEQRLAMTMSWTKGLEHVRNQLHGPQRQTLSEIIAWASEHATPGLPLAQDDKWGVRRWAADTVAIIPIHPSDATLHPHFANLVGRLRYNEDERAVYLPFSRISPAWRGILLVHELRHAMHHHNNTYRDQDEGFWVEEYEVYAEEAQLAQAIYGAAFSRVAGRLSRHFEVELRADRLRINDHQALPEAARRLAFGWSGSNMQSESQRGLLILTALYRALDRIHPDGDKSEHATITRWFCGSKK